MAFSSSPSSSFGSLSRERVARAEKKMIYRKWSLLTGPASILGSIVATVVVANYLFVQHDPFLKVEPRKQDGAPSTK